MVSDWYNAHMKPESLVFVRALLIFLILYSVGIAFMLNLIY